MTWTSSKPTVPGFYFWRGEYPERNPQRVLEIYLNGANVLMTLCACGVLMNGPVDELGGEWSDMPLTPPSEENKGNQAMTDQAKAHEVWNKLNAGILPNAKTGEELSAEDNQREYEEDIKILTLALQQARRDGKP